MYATVDMMYEMFCYVTLDFFLKKEAIMPLKVPLLGLKTSAGEFCIFAGCSRPLNHESLYR